MFHVEAIIMKDGNIVGMKKDERMIERGISRAKEGKRERGKGLA